MENLIRQLNRLRDRLIQICFEKYEVLIRNTIKGEGDMEINNEAIRKLNYLKEETKKCIGISTTYLNLAYEKQRTINNNELFRSELDMILNDAETEAVRISSELNQHIRKI